MRSRGCSPMKGPPHVVNLAAQAGVRYSLKNPHAYIDANIVGFLNILEGCRYWDIAHLVYTSSSSVYGANMQLPFRVDHSVDHPISLYAATKKSNELMAHCYSHLYGFPTTGLRFFTVCGPWGRPDMAFFAFTRNILADKPIDVFNFGKHRRDFTYIDDIVEALVRILVTPAAPNEAWFGENQDPATSSAPYRLYNIGNNRTVDLEDYIGLLEKALGKKAKRNLLPLREGDVVDTMADVDESSERFRPSPTNPREGGNRAIRGVVSGVLRRKRGLNITIIGTGYVGLVSEVCFAEFGDRVVCVDTDVHKLAGLNRGKAPFYEPGLHDLLSRNIEAGRLHFSRDFSPSVSAEDIVFIAVGTPPGRGDGHADLSYVFEAARMIAPHLAGYTVVVDKSTVPVGTARQVHRIIRNMNPTADFDVAANPEFLREGSAISDFMHPDRVIIGLESMRAEASLRELYQPLHLAKIPLFVTNPETAELIKYVSNAFLATKISFINEISALCETMGVDVHAVAQGIGSDHRIGHEFLQVGPGYGGSCFPKDTLALIRTAREHGVPLRIVEAAVKANAAQKARMIQKIRQALGGSEAGKRLAVLGLTFKPETDDMREAPTLTILPPLLKGGAQIRAHDPRGMEKARNLLEGIHYCEDLNEATVGVDAVILLTEWNAYRALDLERIRKIMRGNVFIDLRNVYEPDRMKEAGFAYFCVGRPDLGPKMD
uniref:UDP-glucose 6-dehydrogenase n=1 Tax=Candidatus Kentrum sp. LFY TaxID=2126342 RepID=A0A450USE3_9GAMM|nr:MAG: nucleotide sugar dehydrogenase [Candidatus Kentron sp. LFY]